MCSSLFPLPSLAPFLLPGDRDSELGSQRDSRWSLGHGEGTGRSEERGEGGGRRAGTEGARARHRPGRGTVSLAVHGRSL